MNQGFCEVAGYGAQVFRVGLRQVQHLGRVVESLGCQVEVGRFEGVGQVGEAALVVVGAQEARFAVGAGPGQES